MSRASLPEKGYTAPSRLADPFAPLIIKVIAEGTGAVATFDFGTMPVSTELQSTLAAGFVAITGPGGSRRTIPSARTAFGEIRVFARSLAKADPPPTKVSELRASHVDGLFLFASPGSLSGSVSTLRSIFRKTDVAPEIFMRRLLRGVPKQLVSDPVHSYTREEFRLIMRAARETVRSANDRIRRARGIVSDYRSGVVLTDPVLQREAAYMSLVMDKGDYPRTGGGHVTARGLSVGSRPSHLLRALHLTIEETGALIALLMGLTGHNLAQIVTLPAAHHRADAQRKGATPTVLVRASKMRRGANKSEMTIPLTGIPTWIVPADEALEHVGEDGRLDLHSAFGVYMAAMQLGVDARRFIHSDRLLAFYSTWRKGDVPRRPYEGFREAQHSTFAAWVLLQNIVDSKGDRVQPGSRRMRLTFLEHKQKPVAQSPSTFVNQYLVRNRGDIAEYQRIVSDVLDSEVARANKAVAEVISESTIRLAQTDLPRAAVLANVSPQTLTRALAGELDTVMNSCIDHDHSPYSSPGSPCGASFMLCLGCPNARAEPRHLPVQMLVLSGIESRRNEMEALAWATRFALPHSRLTHLLEQFPTATVEAARGKETEADKALVTRFLGRELDVK